ncbi:MAG TPA: excinuclease ABC subunit UvrA, partial [bacterium]|nr:excinuclease ABC subunit UvrA [bacterium]
MHTHITITGAREHNLKNLTVAIPKGQLVVLTGISGSGKSTLAFDILQREGQRQVLEALGMVTHNASRPNVTAITGLAPAISIGQHLSNRSPRSTVGTATEIYTYLRVLFARLGHRPCPHCGNDIPPQFTVAQDEQDWQDDDEPDSDSTIPCPHCGTRVPELTMTHFSFNKLAGACPTCTGLGSTHQANLARLLDASKSVPDGGVPGWHPRHEVPRNIRTLEAAGRHYGRPFDTTLIIRDYADWQRDLLVYGVESQQFRRHFPGVEPPVTVESGRFEGVATALLRRHAEHADQPEYLAKLAPLLITATCPECLGERLNPASRAVTVNGQNICAIGRLPVSSVAAWLDATAAGLSDDARAIAQPILDDLTGRIRRVLDVGVGYLSLDRSSPTLSAGEGQRLRLAALLGSGLTGMLYIFDEPTTGLHQRDTARLIRTLRGLRDGGNTVLVIEHDTEMMLAADTLIDIGPGAGTHGGQLVACGTPDEVRRHPTSLTARALAMHSPLPPEEVRRDPAPLTAHTSTMVSPPPPDESHQHSASLSGRASTMVSPLPPGEGRVRGTNPFRDCRPGNGNFLTVRGASEHNLKDIDVRFPLGTFIALTGVSGSGKSTLAFDILDRAGRQRFYQAADMPGRHAGIDGWEHIDRLITIDQSPIGRMPRSNAATYTDIFTAIRTLFAAQPAAAAHRLASSHFSFNTPGGRCAHCEGAGVLSIHMHFLPAIEVRCPTCRGHRFRREVLAVTYRGRTIADVLAMTIDEAAELFTGVPVVARKLKLMREVGLGYLRLGQGATTLSGGEAQRIKLSRELAVNGRGRGLYLLDEPSSGLHPHDVAHLLVVLQRLVDQGNTVLVVEHNLDVIRAADWVIDLGPE